MDYYELECAVEEWAQEKGIMYKANPMAQALKTLEECTELCTAINNKDREEIIDAMGDIMVTLVIQAKIQNVSLESCLETAYKVISKRRGRMINGTFIKDL
tara:strand:+ start:6014 stop:6316 length:303 start_codon:yes stop_codon:yes gene_type:complete